jgi:hypothetical protein
LERFDFFLFSCFFGGENDVEVRIERVRARCQKWEEGDESPLF